MIKKEWSGETRLELIVPPFDGHPSRKFVIETNLRVRYHPTKVEGDDVNRGGVFDLWFELPKNRVDEYREVVQPVASSVTVTIESLGIHGFGHDGLHPSVESPENS